MKAKLLLFVKIKLSDSAFKILFALQDNKIVEVSLEKNDLKNIIKKNKLIRHEKFDWHVNKNINTRYLLELTAKKEDQLPSVLNFLEEKIDVNWFVFPKAVKLLKEGVEKNFLQLAVQYISNGGIDESVIAADYDAEFIKTLQEKLTEDKN
ncbi:hypothetical protein [Fluviispira multicolorata]|uniref:Uncharacterized protein n=1 Tax=Fluviispira multicolorata TaxID=2654512 RepID=A0A833JD31_9BACT|nr:hypothetical protein [Fluviispira multicolorata]KAB8027987.1 hypothetical protein GCL57_13105 [Fluviispira multicolorata]